MENRMKILSISDRVEPFLNNRFDAEKISGVDLILSCGDLPPEYLTFLATALNAPLFYIKGNHDIRYDTKPPEGCNNIHRKLVQFNGLKFLGLEGSRWYNGGPYQHTEQQMQKIIRGLKASLWWKGGVDIIISHAPLRHVHDAEDRCHRGFKCFHQLISRYAPEYFIHGHIHAVFNKPSERITIINHTKVVNSYGHFLFEIDIPQKTVEKQFPEEIPSEEPRV
jgi:Icc-related predicted phosphoesterase